MPYHDFWLAGRGGLSDVAYPSVQASSRAYKEWTQMFTGDFDGALVYEKLNNLSEGRAWSDAIEVGSSRNATVKRKMPFPVAEILTLGYHVQKDADICHFIPILNGILYLGHRFNQDSVQITAKDWRPYQFFRPRKSNEGQKSNSESKSSESSNASLKKKLVGKWRLIDCNTEFYLEPEEDDTLFLTFTDDGKMIKEATDLPLRTYKYWLRGNVVYISDEDKVDSCYITFKNDYFIATEFFKGPSPPWVKYKKVK